METPEIDDTGYPTKETLETIKKWNVINDAQGLFDFIGPIFNYGFGKCILKDNVYEISTGGWSGCEDTIEAMGLNHIFWGVFWLSSRRGGHHEFKKPDKDT